MSWHTIEMHASVQVFPSYEHGHVLGLDCWCGPSVERERDALPIVSHRDDLERTGPADPEAEAA